MVEPLASSLEAGERNFALNAKSAIFVRASIDSLERPETEVQLWPGMNALVETTTVDASMERFELTHLDILHSDIQAAEARMLTGAKSALESRRITWIFISTHGENIHQKCAQLLRSHRYKIVPDHTPSESHSVDGLLAAASDKNAARVAISRRRSWKSLKARLRASLRVRVLEPLGVRVETS